jgi:sporulation protein YlmC with PRC-barrel domain
MDAGGGRVKRISDLLDMQVVTESGDKLGHALDFRAEMSTGRLKVVGIFVSRRGLEERLGTGRLRHKGSGQIVPWDAVLRFYGGKIVVRDDVG